ncbi:MAG: hypothetical protein ACD_3C00049G0009 [uncultured bacterium (gcode 4)]|uniref:Protein CR006 P-loop domain-containing protein n=1 Tax=uncultured bacterium (gcode 4) TaxID=1234023 RepID=K2G2N9_9BACT|nr:MAG: hypothetical protein ACD_3C00049G0009 [uncultured bacterium (gcode 4)]
MIKKIKKISQIGVFENFSGWSHEFWTFTAFFWENTYGKTTLAKVFKSLGSDIGGQLDELTTIAPTISWISQEIEIKGFDTNTNSEYPIKYIYGSANWTDNKLKGNLYVFDNDFIHKHLITWIDITHGNKEKFTDFILWDEAVQSINQIEELKKKTLLLKNDLKSLKPPYLAKEFNETKIREYLHLNIETDEESIKKRKEQIRLKITNLNSSDSIVKLPDIDSFVPNFLNAIVNEIEKINLVIAKDFQDVTSTTLENIKAHIRTHTNSWDAIDGWIKTWFLDHKKWDICPFCGQDTIENPLLEDFSKFFNEAYSEFSTSIIEDLKKCVNALYLEIKLDAHDYLKRIIVNLQKYYVYDNTISIPGSTLELVEEISVLEKVLT